MTSAAIGSGTVFRLREEWLAGREGFLGVVGRDELSEVLRNVDVLFIGVAAGERLAVAAEAARCGVHVFLEWPPAVSIAECGEIVRLVEEAGLEAGVSRPLRFHARIRGLPWRADLSSLRLARSNGSLYQELADLVDLACTLAGSTSVLRVDAGIVREHDLAAFGLRFHSGAYSQAVIQPSSDRNTLSVTAAAAADVLEVDIDLDHETRGAVGEETRQFLAAVVEERSVPVTALDAMHTMRVVERLMGNLR